MAVVEWKGIGQFTKWVNRMADMSGFDDMLEDIGKTSVTLTTKKIANNKVRPKTTLRTLRARRSRKKRPSVSGITMLDTGVGYKQPAYRVISGRAVDVGYPDGYMAYHQEGRVPNAPQRKTLTLPSKRALQQITKFHWERLARK